MSWLEYSELADIAGCLGFVFSILIAASSCWKKRMNLCIEIDFDALSNNSFLSSRYLNSVSAFSFTNKSANPISINYISIECVNNATYRCSLEKGFVAHHFRPLIDTNLKFYENIKESADFPIELNSYGASYQYIYFSLPRDLDISGINLFRISTNHGYVIIDDCETIQRFQQFLSEAYPTQQESDPLSRSVGGSLQLK